MAKDHFLPATLISRFSESPADKSRLSKVWTLRRNGVRVPATAESVGYTNGLYDVDEELFPTHGTRAVDGIWGDYEGSLSTALDRLIDGTVTASEWIDTLVPFVAAAFARDRGYKERVRTRLLRHAGKGILATDPELADHVLDETNIALNRVAEMERFAARALASHWDVVELSEDLVLPDVGYGFELVNQYPDVLALLFPIGLRHVLVLTPCSSRRILERRGTEWVPTIAYGQRDLPAGLLNRELAKTAQDFLVGTEAGIGPISPDDLGVFTWETIDELLEQWPFSVDTLELLGLHKVVQAVVHGEITSLDGVLLNRHLSLAEREPQGVFIAADPRTAADRFLDLGVAGLTLSVGEIKFG